MCFSVVFRQGIKYPMLPSPWLTQSVLSSENPASTFQSLGLHEGPPRTVRTALISERDLRFLMLRFVSPNHSYSQFIPRLPAISDCGCNMPANH